MQGAKPAQQILAACKLSGTWSPSPVCAYATVWCCCRSGSLSSVSGVGEPTCDVFICHTSSDSGWLATRLQNELTNHGLKAFLDEGTVSAGWAERVREAAWSCRIFIVLVSPGFFASQMPVLELRTALTRAAQPLSDQQGALPIVPVYVSWTRSQALQAL